MFTQRFSAALLIFFFAGSTSVFSQAQPKPKMAVINLSNPSFEDVPRAGQKGGTAPAGWYDCGPQSETSPDIQPGFFGVIKPPSNGSSFLGLVVRDNETYESVAQRLPQPLMSGNCYEWNIDLCRADEYNSQTSSSGGKTLSFASAVQVRIWGGNGFCDRQELLYTTPYVVNTRWMGYLIPLKPKKGNYSFIIIEAYFKTPMLFPYNGNVLIDNASAIKQMPCDEKKEDPVAKAEVKRTTPPGKAAPPKAPTAKATPPPPAVPKVETTKTISETDPTKIKKGDILQIQNLYFDANQFNVKTECEATLAEVYDFLAKNPKLVVEVAGHTNNRPSDSYANTLSTNRAKAVCDWLISKGIPKNRIQYKGYGKTLPIAPNTTDDGRRKNQRVEIRVLSVNG